MATHQNAFARDCFFFFKRSASRWIMVDSVIVDPGHLENRWGYNKVWTSPWGAIYSLGAGVFELQGNLWLRIFENQNALVGISAVTKTNIFVAGHFGTLLHYNGTDWYQYRQFQRNDLAFWGVWTNGEEVFVVGHDGARSFVFHGK